MEVPLGARAYSILIGPGLLDDAGAEIAKIAPGVNCAVVTDARVAPLYLDRLTASLDQAGLRSTSIVCPPGEGAKSYSEFARVADALIEARIERRDVVIALGGGVIGDLAGFCAATLRRGVRLVQIPTTLLAQVDFKRGRQDGNQFAARKESSSAPFISHRWCWPTPHASIRLASAIFAPASPRSSNTG